MKERGTLWNEAGEAESPAWWPEASSALQRRSELAENQEGLVCPALAPHPVPVAQQATALAAE